MLPHETIETACGKRFLESRSPAPFIFSQHDFLDLLVRGMEQGTSLFLLQDSHFDPAFFDLKTRLAGDILQKAADYRARLAIVGSFAMVRSPRFRQLMLESRKGSLALFASGRDEGIAWLVR